MTPQDLHALTAHDVYQILKHWEDRIIVFVGMDDQGCITPSIECISMNGDVPQINTVDPYHLEKSSNG